MEIHTAVLKASSSSSMQMQLNEQINLHKLSITANPYEEIERHQFINKAKKEINNFTQVVRQLVKGSLNFESIAPFDVEILDIHWNKAFFLDVIDTNDAVIQINLDIIDEETELELQLQRLIWKSIQPVERLIMSDEYSYLHDDLKALEEEQCNWLMLDLGIRSESESDSDSGDKGMMLDSEDKGIHITQMEIHTGTAVKASSSSGMEMQLNEQEQINFIKRKTDKLSITENPYEIEREEYECDQFINKAKKEINHFTQLIRELVKGSLNFESIAPFDVEIFDIHWNKAFFLDVIDTNDAVIQINLDIIDEETELELQLQRLIWKSIQPVERLIMSDEYSSLHDDLKALEEEQCNWLMLDLGIRSESDSDSEDKGMMLD